MFASPGTRSGRWRDAVRPYQRETPATGATVICSDAVDLLMIDPAAPLAALTVVLPRNPPQDGVRFWIATSQTIAALTISAGGGQALIRAPTTLAPGVTLAFLYVAAVNEWVCTNNGGIGSAPVVRGTPTTGSSTTTSITLALPAGTAAGDLGVIISSGGNTASSSGWTVIAQNGGFWNNMVLTKTITSGDVSTGSITVTIGAGFINCFSLSTFAAGAYVAAFGMSNLTVQSTSTTWMPDFVFLAPQVGKVDANPNTFWLMWVSGRGASTTMSISPGTIAGSAMTNANGSAVLYTNTFATGLPMAIGNHNSNVLYGLGDIMIGILAP